MKMIFSITLLLLMGLMSCSNPSGKSIDNQKDTASAASQEKNVVSNVSTTADTSHWLFTFTARGDSVSCTPDPGNGGQVMSMFTRMDYAKSVHDLRLVAVNDSASAMHLNSLTLHLYTHGKLATGSYPIARFDTVQHWVDVTDSGKLDNVCYATVAPIGTFSQNISSIGKQLWSASGTLTIKKVNLDTSNINPADSNMAYGTTISGTFSFSGQNPSGKNPGSCRGSFNNIPVMIDKTIYK